MGLLLRRQGRQLPFWGRTLLSEVCEGVCSIFSALWLYCCIPVLFVFVDAESRRVRTEWRASLIRMPLRITHIMLQPHSISVIFSTVLSMKDLSSVAVLFVLRTRG